MKRNLTCIVCPMGCSITVTYDENGITDITGNTCPKGKEYAQNECTNPKRVVTSTVMTGSGRPIPVKTDKAIPKDKVFECMKIINETTVKGTPEIGDIVLSDVFGANIVVTGVH